MLGPPIALEGAVNEGLPSPNWGRWTDLNLMAWQPGMKLPQAPSEMRKIGQHSLPV